MSEVCKGCSIYDVCNYIDYNNIMKDCPCCKCLVKITCLPANGCDDYYEYFDKMEPGKYDKNQEV